eukprot:TRINITY_DN4976_c0_g1_i1.p1 TRINITY_DN4976_c0_g1~~TRINITY_DN4976_c0_g1_i1.p1  ORF type:complete len:166 (+),score=31.26 TRINITY_DN4976_c0_g1_i1:82-579(+)
MKLRHGLHWCPFVLSTFIAIFADIVFQTCFVYTIALWICTNTLLGSFLPIVIADLLLGHVHVKKIYNTNHALVTGASSGIGLSICRILAKQGINIVLVAKDDEHLPRAVQELKVINPACEYVSIPIDFASMEEISQEHLFRSIEKYDIGLFVLNAGYIFMEASGS